MAILIGFLLCFQDPAAPTGSEFFEKKIRPLLAERFYPCHSARAGKASGGLTLDSRDGLLRGGDSGPSLVPGDPDHSLLIKAVRREDDSLQSGDAARRFRGERLHAPEVRRGEVPAVGTAVVHKFAGAQGRAQALACLPVEEGPAGLADGSNLAKEMVHSATPFRPPMPSDPDVSTGPGG